MLVTLLGSGTSYGVPVVGCNCSVCRSPLPENKRTRSSILIEEDGTTILVDTSTDFRFQALREGLTKLDAVFYTHSHADHLHGIDDLRQLSRRQPIAVYASRETCQEIEARFPYIFRGPQEYDSRPRISLATFGDSAVSIGPMTVLPVPILHGKMTIHGFRIGDFAYLTDCSYIPDESFELLRGVSCVVVDALRHEPHVTHFTVGQAIQAGRRIGARDIYLTHIGHELEHESLARELPEGVHPGYDGLKLDM
ncbi:MAG TPA: MBL fold metallo-hydrolase [Spirochaetia bacterium]|nr:MBL fold metallo-hydrolase [Spirochaetia bacterium]